MAEESPEMFVVIPRVLLTMYPVNYTVHAVELNSNLLCL